MKLSEQMEQEIKILSIALKEWRDDVRKLETVAEAAKGVLEHWGMSPEDEMGGLEAGFYDHLEDMEKALADLDEI